MEKKELEIGANLQPILDNVLVKRINEPETNTNGVIVPDVSKEESPIADVVAIGENVKNVKVGDRVLMLDYAGTQIPDKEFLMLVRESSIVAIIDKE